MTARAVEGADLDQPRHQRERLGARLLTFRPRGGTLDAGEELGRITGAIWGRNHEAPSRTEPAICGRQRDLGRWNYWFSTPCQGKSFPEFAGARRRGYRILRRRI